MSESRMFASLSKSAALFVQGEGTFHGFFPDTAATLCQRHGGEIRAKDDGVEWRYSNQQLKVCRTYQADIASRELIGELEAELAACEANGVLVPINADRSEIDLQVPIIVVTSEGKGLLTHEEAAATIHGEQPTRVLAQLSLTGRGGFIEDLIDAGVWVGNEAQQNFSHETLFHLASALTLGTKLFEKQWQGELFYPVPGEVRWE